MDRIIYNYLKEKNMLDKNAQDNTTISLEITDNDVIIKGGRIELIELADYILNIALGSFNGCHIHLDQHYFFDEAEKELIVALKLTND